MFLNYWRYTMVSLISGNQKRVWLQSCLEAGMFMNVEKPNQSYECRKTIQSLKSVEDF